MEQFFACRRTSGLAEIVVNDAQVVRVTDDSREFAALDNRDMVKAVPFKNLPDVFHFVFRPY